MPYVACNVSFVAADGAVIGPFFRVLPLVLEVLARRLVERGDYRNARALAHQALALHAVRAGIAAAPPDELIRDLQQ